MAETHANDTQKQQEDRGSDRVRPNDHGRTDTLPTDQNLGNPAMSGLSARAQIGKCGSVSKNMPRWLRPFFSLRIQLISVFVIVLTCIVASLSGLIYQHTSLMYISLVAFAVLIFGSILATFLISILLRPLRRVIDAAQAIAIGDLEQRERLPLRLPPQDDIDRLSGSINEMVTRLEHAEIMQHASELRFKRFFSEASHQLRTPLTSIRGFTEILMRGAIDSPETTQRVLTRMKSEAERMTILINNLLTLARLDDGQSLKTQYVDLIELATEGIKQAKTQTHDGQQITLVLNTQERLGIQADRERIKQLLFILLDNALKYGCPTPYGTVTLQLGKQDGQAILRVIDTGEGISKEDLEHIFDSFYRGRYRQSSSTTETPVVGTGLGLTIATTIVRVHRGTISAYSELGKGTEFKVTLPCVS